VIISLHSINQVVLILDRIVFTVYYSDNRLQMVQNYSI